MYYQDIPFLIVSKDVATAERIASLLKRKSNTQLECYDPDQIWRFQDSINYFTCSVLHYTEEDHLLIEIIDKSLKRHPVSPVYLFSFDPVTPEFYRRYIRMGITDILTYDNSGNIFNDLIESLNNRWKIFRYLERERSKIYHATVVTAYHEINQPLTVMTNAIDLFKIGLKTNDLAPEKIVSNLSFIVRGIKRVQEILEKMKKVEHPKLKAYTKTVPMISLPTEIKTKNQSSENLKLVQEMKVKTGQKNKE